MDNLKDNDLEFEIVNAPTVTNQTRNEGINHTILIDDEGTQNASILSSKLLRKSSEKHKKVEDSK